VVISGRPQAGKTEALRRLAGELSAQDELTVLLVLAGVRPEEVPAWTSGTLEPTAVVTLGGSSDAQAQAVERVVDQGRRLAARGGHAVVLIDTLDGLAPSAARKALAAARRIVDGGSLTVIATAAVALGGETTVIALDSSLTAAGRFPAVDLAGSWTMHASLLVGEAGAEAISRTRAEALAD
jgi:transcription termination factor Rho